MTNTFQELGHDFSYTQIASDHLLAGVLHGD